MLNISLTILTAVLFFLHCKNPSPQVQPPFSSPQKKNIPAIPIQPVQPEGPTQFDNQSGLAQNFEDFTSSASSPTPHINQNLPSIPIKSISEECKNIINVPKGRQHMIKSLLKTLSLSSCEDLVDTLPALTTLDLSSQNITQIDILQWAVNLESLDLSSNGISDLWPLKNLKKIRKLDLSQNNIKDLSPLRELQQLLELSLSQNPLFNLYPLKKMTYLKSLDLSKTGVSDMIFLQDVSELVFLKLSGLMLKNSLFLLDFHMPKLETLDLSENQLSILAGVHYPSSLRHLFLGKNPISQMFYTKETDFLNLIEIDVTDCPIQDQVKQKFPPSIQVK